MILRRTTPSASLPEIDGRTVFHVLILLAGLLGLVILFGTLLYWLLPERFFSVDQTPWPLVFGSLAQSFFFFGAVEFGWRRRKSLSWAGVGFRSVNLKTVATLALAGILLAGGIELIERLLDIKPGDLIQTLIAPDGFNWQHLVIVLLSVGIVAPIAEEVLFRGVFYSWFRGVMGVPVAVVINGAAFGLIHTGYPLELMFLVALMGSIFAISYELTGSLWVPVMLHVAQNSAVVIAIYASLYGSP